MGRGLRGIYKDFYENHGRDFQKRCYEWLSFIYDDLVDAKDLGVIDNEGIDLYVLNKDRENYLKVFQCKGFEKVFGKSQLNQCLKSISSFLKTGLKTNEYYLVINCTVSSEYTAELNTALANLVSKDRARKAKIITANGFVDLYNREFKKLIIKKAKTSNQRFYENYSEIMGQGFYFDRVPFDENDVKKEFPLNYIMTKIEVSELPNKKKTKAKYIHLISDFGFGKTTTLFELYRACVKKKFTPIFIPAAILDSNAFSGTSSMARQIFKILFEEGISVSEKIVRFSSESMTSLLEGPSNIILMFDGLDEHLQLYKLEGLRGLFNSVSNFKIPCIFSFRKSFWEERNGDFNLSLSKIQVGQDYLFLREWDNSQIVEYVDLFMAKNKSSIENKGEIHLNDFRHLVNVDKYDQFYGDIPKRPLFLQMIIRDIIVNEIKIQNISQLYADYFREKFTRDIQGQFENFEPQREIPAKYGVDYLLQLMIEIHEAAANECIKNKSMFVREDALIENNLHEKYLRAVLDREKFGDNLIQFINLSVLTPVTKRGNMNMKLKFAHKSFLEFFIARSLIKKIFMSGRDTFFIISPECYYNYPSSILSFLKGIVQGLIIREGKEFIEKPISTVAIGIGKNSSGVIDYLVEEFGININK